MLILLRVPVVKTTGYLPIRLRRNLKQNVGNAQGSRPRLHAPAPPWLKMCNIIFGTKNLVRLPLEIVYKPMSDKPRPVKSQGLCE